MDKSHQYFKEMKLKDLLEKRIVIIDEPINDLNAKIIVSKLIALNNSSNKDIYVFLNSSGGSVTSGIAVYDTIRWCKCSINTICLQSTSALATLLLTSGTKGKRYAFTDSLIIPTLYWSADKDGGIYTKENSELLNSIMYKTVKILADNTNNDLDTMWLACSIKHKLDSKSAKEKGYIDIVINERINKKNSILSWIPLIKGRKINYSKVYKIIKEYEEDMPEPHLRLLKPNERV